jgi:transposase
MAKKITCWQAAEITRVSARTMRRWREWLEEDGYADWRPGAKGW